MKQLDAMELEENISTTTTQLDEKWVDRIAYINKRFKAMEQWRAEEELKREKYKKAYDAKVPKSRTGKAEVNIPLEQVLVETYIGMQNKLQFSVKNTTGKLDYDYRWLYENVFDHFFTREMCATQIRRYRRQKAKLGTGVLLSSPTFEKRAIYDWKDTKFFSKDSKTTIRNMRHIWLKHIDIEMAYFDEWANQYSECMDCIRVEDVRREEFQANYWDDPDFDIEWVGKFKASMEKHGKEKETDIVRLRHYWNKIDWTYTIVGNKRAIVYDGVYACKHGMLPLIPIQHYERLDSIYGRGIAERLESVRPYINSILKVTLDSAWLNASPWLVTDDNVEVDGEIYLTAWALEEIKMIGQTQGISTFTTNINVAQLVEVLKLMEDFGMVTSGINYKAPYTSPAGTAFEAWLMKEEQNTRSRPVIEVDYEWLDIALTIMLVNIIDFVPYALATEIVDWDSGDKELDRYKIEVEDKKINIGKNGIDIEDAPWIVTELQIKPELFIHWVGLKLEITTPYTSTIMKSIEKAEFGEYIQQYIQLAQIWAPEEMMDKLNDMYGMRPDDMTFKTKSDQNRAKFAEALEIAWQMMQASWRDLSSLQQPNAKDSKQWGLQETPEIQWSEAIADIA